jgi:hypothetical protein
MVALLGVVVASHGVNPVYATTTSTSDNYQATEMQFGAGSNLESCSEEYCAKTSIGDLVGGSGTSAAGTATFGSLTTDVPTLDVIVERGESDLGNLTTESTTTKTMVVRIRSYLSDGYTLQIVGNAPTYQDHALTALTTPTGSEPGTEQFGINAVANTIPEVGANPEQVPDAETSFGFATDDYKTPNLFKYASGDTVARSLTVSGQTNYTISMIINIANNTPAGKYTADFSAVVIPVY